MEYVIREGEALNGNKMKRKDIISREKFDAR